MDPSRNLHSSLISRSANHVPTASDHAQQDGKPLTQYPDIFNQPPAGAVGPPSSARHQRTESFLTPYGTPASISRMHMSHSVDSQSDGSETGLVAPDPPNPTLSSSFATYGCFPLPSLAYGSPCNVSQRFPSPHPRASSRSSLIPPPPAVPDGGGRFVYAGSYADVTQPAPTAVSKLVPEYMQPTTLPLSPDALLAPSFPLDHTSHTRHYNEADALHRKNMQNHYANPHAFGNQYQATSAVSTQFPKRPGSPPASAYYPAAWSSLEPPSHTQHDSWVFLNSDHVFSSSSSELQDNTVSGAPLPGPGSSGPPSQIASPALSQQGTSSTNLRAPREHRRATKRKRVDQPKDPRATPSLRHQRQSNGETITTQIARPALPQQGTSSMTLLDPHEHRCTRECKRVDQPKDPTATTRLRNQRQSDEAITKPQIASPALPNQGTSSTTLRAPHDRRPAPKRKRVDQPKDPKAANRLRKRRESDDRKLEEIFDIAVPSSVGKVPKKDRLDLILQYVRMFKGLQHSHEQYSDSTTDVSGHQPSPLPHQGRNTHNEYPQFPGVDGAVE